MSQSTDIGTKLASPRAVNAPLPDRPHPEKEIVEGPSAWARLGTPLAVLEFVGACVLSGMVVARFVLPGCSSSGCAILSVLYVLPGSVLGGLAVLGVRNLLVREMRTRVMIDVILAMMVLVWWNAGRRIEEHQAHLESQQEQAMRAVERAAAGTEDHYGRNRFLEALRRSGSHGPPGQVPSVLRVQDDGVDAEVELLDSLAAQYPVALARVLADPRAPKGWRGCPMETQGAKHADGAFLLRPREPVRFSLASSCMGEFRDAPIEYRVGSWKRGSGSPGWWSDSAIAVPDGWPLPARAGGARAPAEPEPPPAIIEDSGAHPLEGPTEAPAIGIGPGKVGPEERP